MKKILREYAIITFGLLFVAVGVYYFLVPSNLACGGVSGIGMVIQHFIPNASIGILMMVMNVVLFIIGFIFLGSNFGAKTIYSSFALSGMIWFFEKVLPISKPFVDDLFITLIFGILVQGIGMGIIFNVNASTGGTDIVAKIINKYVHIEIGKALLLSDFFITLAAVFTFGPKIGMYALLGIIINGFVIDEFINGLSISRQVTLITSKGDMVKQFILENLGRGITIYDAKGAFTGEQKEVLITVMARKEFIKLKNYIKEIDKSAFITVGNVHEVLGEGFKRIE